MSDPRWRETGPKKANPVPVLAAAAAVLVVMGFVTWQMSKPLPAPRVFAGGATLADATAASGKSGRPVFVMATADWCMPCRRMRAGTLEDQRVVEWLTTKTEPVYLDIDRRKDEARDLGVRSIPTFMLIRDGRTVARVEGELDTGRFLAWLEGAAAGGGPSGGASAQPPSAAPVTPGRS